MPDLETKDPDAIEMNGLFTKGVEAAKWSIVYFVELGDKLKVKREELGSRNFSPWIKKHTTFGKTNAYRFIKLSDNKEILSVPTLERIESLSHAFRLIGEHSPPEVSPAQTPESQAPHVGEGPEPATSHDSGAGGSPGNGGTDMTQDPPNEDAGSSLGEVLPGAASTQDTFDPKRAIKQAALNRLAVLEDPNTTPEHKAAVEQIIQNIEDEKARVKPELVTEYKCTVTGCKAYFREEVAPRGYGGNLICPSCRKDMEDDQAQHHPLLTLVEASGRQVEIPYGPGNASRTVVSSQVTTTKGKPPEQMATKEEKRPAVEEAHPADYLEMVERIGPFFGELRNKDCIRSNGMLPELDRLLDLLLRHVVHPAQQHKT